MIRKVHKRTTSDAESASIRTISDQVAAVGIVDVCETSIIVDIYFAHTSSPPPFLPKAEAMVSNHPDEDEGAPPPPSYEQSIAGEVPPPATATHTTSRPPPDAQRVVAPL